MRHEIAFPGLAALQPPESAPAEPKAEGAPGPITIVPRRLDHAIARGFDRIEPASLPNVRAHGTAMDLRRAVTEPIGRLNHGQQGLGDWLIDDVGFLMRLYCEATGAREMLLRIETIDDDACCRFHADNVTYRLVTTYRGPGTEWVPPRDADAIVDGAVRRPEVVQQLKRGEIAILSGRQAARTGVPPVLHRSPRIAGTATVRLFLAIDDARDHDVLAADLPP